MTVGMAKRNGPLLIFLGPMGASLAALLRLPPILQDQDYHQFADVRALFGIPNVWNVISNIPFIVIGAAGLAHYRDSTATVFIFFGIFLTGFGSSYYHWSPNDDTLFWDRLPMALAFMAILANAVEERLNARAGVILLWPLLAIGVFSLLLWRWNGDLRLYGWVQFFPVLALPADVSAASAEIHRHALLDRRHGGLCARQGAGVPRQRDLFNRTCRERAYAQAPRGGRRLLRDPEIFPDSPAYRVSVKDRVRDIETEAPLNRGSPNSSHFRGAHVPVEEIPGAALLAICL